jgi:hypothetical protein
VGKLKAKEKKGLEGGQRSTDGQRKRREKKKKRDRQAGRQAGRQKDGAREKLKIAACCSLTWPSN